MVSYYLLAERLILDVGHMHYCSLQTPRKRLTIVYLFRHYKIFVHYNIIIRQLTYFVKYIYIVNIKNF